MSAILLPLLAQTGPAPVDLSYLTNATIDGINAASHTFSSQSFGAAAADRYILVAAQISQYTGNPVISGVTVGGVGATELIQSTLANTRIGFYIAAVPTGTSGSVVVSRSGSNIRQAVIGLWRLTGLLSPAAYATLLDETLSSNQFSGNINVAGGGVIVAAATQQGASGWSWTELTEHFDVSNTQDRVAAASKSYAAAQSGVAISATGSGGDVDASFVAVSLR